jgi:hypothetical protein
MNAWLCVWLMMQLSPAPTSTPRPIEPRVPHATEPATDLAPATADDVAASNVEASTQQLFAVEVSMAPETVPLGGVVVMTIDLDRPVDAVVNLARELPSNDAFAPAPAPPMRKVTPQPSSSHEQIRIAWVALDLGDVATPPLVIDVVVGTKTEHIDIAAQPVRVTPLTLPEFVDAGPEGASPQFEPHASALLFAVNDYRPLVLALWVAVAGVGLWWVAVALRRRRARVGEVALAPPPPVPPHVLALQRLDALLAENLVAQGKTEWFVQRLMDEVLRGYVSARFDLAAGSATTRELVARLLGMKEQAGLDVDLVRQMLEDADVVKFAQGQLGAARANDMADRVRRFVETTTTNNNTNNTLTGPS